MAAKRLLIAVTGTPAAGKSHFAKLLAEKTGARLIEINDVVERHKLYSVIDSLGSKVVKIRELDEQMKREIDEAKGNVIVVGHLVPELTLGPDVTVAVRVGLKELIGRLEERGYQKEKIHENIVAEVTDYCGLSSKEQSKEFYEVESDEEKVTLLLYLQKLMNGERAKRPESNERDKLKELVELISESGNPYGL